jgi:hypothetical protein
MMLDACSSLGTIPQGRARPAESLPLQSQQQWPIRYLATSPQITGISQRSQQMRRAPIRARSMRLRDAAYLLDSVLLPSAYSL